MSKLSIIVSSERLDKLYPAVILASSAATMGWDVELFFTFFGLLVLKKGYQPSSLSTDYSSYNEIFSEAISKGSMPRWDEMLIKAKETRKLKVFACTTTMGLLQIGKNDLKEFVDDFAGSATFLDRSKESDINLFL
ncbi:MAG: DsrE/DsrF/DrsH-like family protein [Candidatus Methylarchaceae archaeon HK01B]|nr:DsrE/DsrF/DrsH-like family protein [Candidatus Methylarchaceae archaeon HK01B]